MKKIISLMLCLCTLCLAVQAQQKQISGKVTDEAGAPVAGATVTEKGTRNGTSTAADGTYRLSVADNNAVVSVERLGYAPFETSIGNRITLNVTLSTTATQIDEVVVVGYGTQQKATVTGSIATVSSEDIKKSPSVSVTNALTGRMAGVITQQTSGRPGMDEASIYIRGRSSLNSSSPLVLVDGIERSFSQVDPDEIESVSVLKDASATAVYGVRGANGVILVTTKRGSSGKTKVSFSAEYGLNQLMRLPQNVNAWEHAIMYNEGAINDGLIPTYTEQEISWYKTGERPWTHPDNDFVGTFFKLGPQQKYNLNVSGGTDRVKYFVSFGYTHQGSIYETDIDKLKKRGSMKKLFDLNPDLNDLIKNPDYDTQHSFGRKNIRTNIDIDVTKDFKIGLDLAYRNESTNSSTGAGQAGMNMFGAYTRCPRNVALINENGTLATNNGNALNMNPFVNNFAGGHFQTFKNSLEGTITLNYDLGKLLKGFSWNARMSINTYSQSRRYIGETQAVWYYDWRTDTYTRLRAAGTPNRGYVVLPASRKIYAETSFKYKRTFAKAHTVSALLLVNVDSQVKPQNDDDSDYLYSNIPQIYQGVIGRVNYDYKAKYLLEVNFGYNGSNRFEKGERYALFPAASVGWVISKENFFADKVKPMSYFKLKASAGQVGNDKLSSGDFQYYNEALYESGLNYNFGTTPTNYTGITEGLGMTSAVTWEVATKYNVGIETQWWKNRISFNFDAFYEKRTGNLTTPGQYLIAAGVRSYPQLNIGEVENKGLEAELGWNHHIGKEFNYYVKSMFTFARNKILEQGEQVRAYDYMYRTGHRIGQQFGYLFDGFFQNYEQIAVAAAQFGTLQPGDLRYRDLNGDGVINDSDITAHGFSNIPEIMYSATVGFSYKGFAISAMFQGAANTTVSLGAEVEWDFYNLASAQKTRHLARWTPETAATATYHRLTSSAIAGDNNYLNSQSSFYSHNANYLRLKNLELSYTFPKSWLRKTPLAGVMFYASGYNLFTWDSLKVVDPESRTGRAAFYPQTRIYNFGINVTF